MSEGVVPMPLLARPTNRSVAVSSVENCNVPLPLTCWLLTAVPSEQPLQPPFFDSVMPFSTTFIRLIQVASPAAGAGDGVVGSGVVGTGATGVGAAGGGVVGNAGAGVVGAGAPGDTPILSCGMRTMNASCRPVPMFAVQMKYSPVTSMLPDG